MILPALQQYLQIDMIEQKVVHVIESKKGELLPIVNPVSRDQKIIFGLGFLQNIDTKRPAINPDSSTAMMMSGFFFNFINTKEIVIQFFLKPFVLSIPKMRFSLIKFLKLRKITLRDSGINFFHE